MGITENMDEFVAIYHHKNKDINMYEALKYILTIENIVTREELDKYCECDGRKLLYKRIQNISHTHWNKIENPESSIRGKYETILLGYKNYNHKLK